MASVAAVAGSSQVCVSLCSAQTRRNVSSQQSLKPAALSNCRHIRPCVSSSKVLAGVPLSYFSKRARTFTPRVASATVAEGETVVEEAAPVEEQSEVTEAEPAAPVEGETETKPARRPFKNRRKITVKLEDLQAGQVLPGKVRSIQSYGCFVDIGAFTDGLIHISELADQFVENVGDLVEVGQEVQARILEVDSAKGRISLSLRTPREERPEGAEGEAAPRSGGGAAPRGGDQRQRGGDQRPRRATAGGRGGSDKPSHGIRKGQKFEGTVTSIAPFGAFLELKEGVEGLLHASEIGEGSERVEVEKHLTVGQKVKVTVLAVTKDRISLTTKERVDTDDINTRLNQGSDVGTAGITNPFEAAFKKSNLVLDTLPGAEELAKTKNPEPAAAASDEIKTETEQIKKAGLFADQKAEDDASAEKTEEPAAEDAAGEGAAEAATAVEEKVEEATESVKEAVEPVTEAVEPVVDEVTDAVTEAAEPVVEEVKEAAEPVTEAVQPVVEDVKEAVTEAAKPVKEAAEPAVEKVTEAVSDVAEPVTKAAEPAVEAAEDQIGQVVDVAEPATNAVQDAVAAVQDQVEGAVDNVKEAAEPVVEKAGEVFDNIKEAVLPAAEEAKEEAAPAVEAAKEGAPSAAEQVKEAADEGVSAVGEVADQVTAAAEEVIKGGEEAPAAQPEQPKKEAGGISASLVKALRAETGSGMMDCKKALAEAGGDLDKARDILRKKGLASADKKAARVAAEGAIGSYIHDTRIGVLLELNCETDFVSRGDTFKELLEDLAMQVAACPQVEFVSVDEVPAEVVAKEREIEAGKEDLANKPPAIREKMVDGRINKRLGELALLEQPFIKDDKLKVKDLVKQTVAKIGENIQVRRFARFTLGEGLEKKTSNLAAEVAEQTQKKEAAPAPPAEPKKEDAPAAKPAVAVSAAAVKELRAETGAGMMDCKKALAECENDVEKARELLRKKGLASAEKKSSRLAAEGAVGSYIHDGRIGVLVEVNCETDFVARGAKFKELVEDVAMQVAACPGVTVVSPDDVPKEVVAKEREIELGKEDLASKPEAIREKIVDGRIAKRVNELALLEQPYIRDDKQKLKDVIKAAVAVLGENIQVRRFERFNLGEGIEKKSVDFAAEVAAQTGKA